MDRPRITIFDTTLRDGEQSPGCSMNVQEKLRLAQQLDRLGVDVIEAGFPIASDGDFEAVQRIAASVRRPIIAGLARACTGDVDRAWEALRGAAHPRIHIVLATSDIHLKYKLRITRAQCLERARNASLEEIVMAMRVRPDRYAYETGVASEHLYSSSRMLAEITRVPVQPNKAIIGRNAFAHEAGIHQDGMLKNPLTYEIMTPQSVGVPDSRLVLGKHSGRHALALRCEQLGHQFERRELDEVYRRFVVLADRIKKVQDSHLLELIQDVASGVSSGSVGKNDGAGGQSKKFPPAAATLPFPRAVSAAAGANANESHPAQISGSAGQASVSIPFTDHHSEQEDYLWGV